MSRLEFKKGTSGEGFYDITQEVKGALKNASNGQSGIATLFIKHTSCALTINESFDPSAKRDMERFLKVLAPRNMKWIEHTAEGEDDSPSHMKSMLLQQSITLIVEKGDLELGTWQGIYLAEFRDDPKTRSILVKFIAD